ARTYDFDVYGVDRGAAVPEVRCEGDPAPCEYRPAGPGEAPDRYAIDPGDGGAAFTLPELSFTYLSLRGNAVLRWEYRPGSTLYAVWQRTRDDFARYDGADVVDDYFDAFGGSVR